MNHYKPRELGKFLGSDYGALDSAGQEGSLASCTAPFLSAHGRKPSGAFFTPARLVFLTLLICCHLMALRSALPRSAPSNVTPDRSDETNLAPQKSPSERSAESKLAWLRSLCRKLAPLSEA